MEDGHDDLEGAASFLFIDAGRDAAAVVANPYGVVFQYLDVYLVAEAAHGFVNAVVDHLVDKMVKTPHGNVADIHRRPLAHGLEPFQNLYAVRGILLFRLDHFVFL